MARWVILRGEEGGRSRVFLFYDNLVTGKRFKCGDNHPSATDEMVVDWIFSYGQPAYGDQFLLSDGSVFVYQRNRAQA